MEWFKVTEVSQKLNVNHTTIYRKIKKLKKHLHGETKRKNGTLLLTEKAIEILKNTLVQKREEDLKPKTFDEKLCNDIGMPMGAQMCAQKNAKEELYQEMIDREMLRKDEALKRKDEIIQELIQTHAKDRERTDTIIMKMTNDMEQVRSENRLHLEESKKKEEPKKQEPKKTDRVISIQEFINAKIEEDIERSNYEAEKKRLKQQYDNPLQGRSALYKIYVKMFRPERMRRILS